MYLLTLHVVLKLAGSEFMFMSTRLVHLTLYLTFTFIVYYIISHRTKSFIHLPSPPLILSHPIQP